MDRKRGESHFTEFPIHSTDSEPLMRQVICVYKVSISHFSMSRFNDILGLTSGGPNVVIVLVSSMCKGYQQKTGPSNEGKS